MSDNYQTVLNHLLFHKALISETEGGQRINRYLGMLNEIDQGMHVAVRDPFEKSVVAAFELVLERHLDPWEINLVPFTKLFLEKVKKDGAVNFVTAGKLVFLAWSILKMQSDKVLLDAMPPEPPSDGGDRDAPHGGDPPRRPSGRHLDGIDGRLRRGAPRSGYPDAAECLAGTGDP